MSSAVQISTGTEFIQANTTTNPGVLLLPSTFTTPGRILTIKDITGSFGRNPLTLSTITGSFEDGTTRKRLTEPFGYLTLASDGISKWYNIDGTSLNTYTISNVMNPLGVSTATISSANVSVTTLGFVDRSFNTTSTLYVRSTLLYLGSNVIGGCMVGPTQFLRMGGTFNPAQISGLQLWMDAADVNTVTVSNNSVSKWTDKSSNRYIFTGSAATLPTYTSRLNGLQVLSSATGQKLTLTNWNQNFTFATMFFLIRPRQNIVVDYQSYPIIRAITGTGTMNLDITYANVFPYYYYLQIWTNNSFILQASLNISGTFNPTNLPLLMTGVANGIANGNIGRYNGTTLATTPLNNATTYVNVTGATIDLIGSSDARNFDTAEILLYGRVLTTLEYQQVEGYLSWKWGLVANLPSNHPYKNAPP